MKNTSIKQRLTYIIMSISCISVVLTTLAISVIGVYNLRASILGQLDISASIVGDRNVAILLFGTPEDAANNLTSVFSVQPTIVQACLYKENGQLFAHYVGKPQDGKAQCPDDLGARAVIGKHHIELMKPIIRAQDKTGYIYLESTLEQIDSYIEKQITIAMTVALAALAVSYLLAIGLQRAISDPILSLTETARAVSRAKDYSIRAELPGDPQKEHNNELVVLTESFNAMLTEIDARDHQLLQQNTELEKARDSAESANRAKSQFLANISHELRTPLNAVIGFSSILMNQLFGALGDQKYLEYARDINESGTHLLDIINDILDLSKAEAGKLILTLEEVHVGKAINKCLTILSERAAKGKVTLVADVPKTLPPLVADRLRFIQVLLNILSNAIKFTEEDGTVTLTITKPEDGADGHFTIVIEDNGIGMSAEDVAKAFQSFGQVDSGLNRKYEGTGLGLPLTKKLMELHFGTIVIESTLGEGTKVTLGFPAMPPASVNYHLID